MHAHAVLIRMGALLIRIVVLPAASPYLNRQEGRFLFHKQLAAGKELRQAGLFKMVAKSMMLLFREAKGAGQSSSCLIRGSAAGGVGGRASKQMAVMRKDEAAAAAAVGEGADDDERRKMKQSWWMPHPRSGIYYPLGHEWVIDDVPEGAASSHFTFWLRSSEGVDHPPSDIYDLPSSNAHWLIGK